MRSKWVTVLAGIVAAVVAVSVAIGLASPDGSVGGSSRSPAEAASTTRADSSPSPATTPPATTPPATAPPATATAPRRPSADRAPASVRGVWPGRPAGVEVDGSRVDWCPAVRTSGHGAARQVFGADGVDAAACAAVRFVLEQRYSRLSLPRRTYRADDFDAVTDALAASTARTYRPRIDRFVAAADDRDAVDDLGLVLLRGLDDSHRFYGPALSTAGYRGRAVWINPRWSTVSIGVDRAKAEPRIVAAFTASAAVPVFDTAARRDAMMTVPTRATMFLRRAGSTWRVSGWSELADGPYEYARLSVA